MQRLEIQGNRQHPTIILDKDAGIFEFSGRSLPEDAISFYTPALDWLDEYSKSPLPKTVVAFRYLYYNTASAKVISEIFEILENIHKAGNLIDIEWHYNEIDEDMLRSGTVYSEMIEIPFRFISHTN